jgi:hypothetical protein
MNDIFKRGYGFDGETGEKTGANLEDMVTRAVLVDGSQLVDQASLETYEDTGVTDDDGAAIYRARVKAGGITGAMLASTAMFGPSVAVTNAMFGFDNFASGSPLSSGDLDLILTANNTTASAALVTAANTSSSIYCTFPSDVAILGTFVAKIRTTGIVSTIFGSSSLDLAPTFTAGAWEFSTSSPFASSTITATDKDWWLVFPFFGKSVGLENSQGSGGSVSMKILRWAVYGNAITNL